MKMYSGQVHLVQRHQKLKFFLVSNHMPLLSDYFTCTYLQPSWRTLNTAHEWTNCYKLPMKQLECIMHRPPTESDNQCHFHFHALAFVHGIKLQFGMSLSFHWHSVMILKHVHQTRPSPQPMHPWSLQLEKPTWCLMPIRRCEYLWLDSDVNEMCRYGQHFWVPSFDMQIYLP